MTSREKPPSDEPHGRIENGGAPGGPGGRESKTERAPRNAPRIDATPSGDSITFERQIGPYQILGILGSGGMGDVFLAFDDRLQRHVAIKRIRASKMNAVARERLRREAAAAAKLSHPAIVHVYDILDDASGDAIVMEHVEGQTLAQLLARGGLPAWQVIGIARQVTEGLAAAHGVGVIHRDLKAQNVMVTPSGQAKILDFGLAKPITPQPEADELTANGILLGTARAMSPEQAQGHSLDARSDLFSLGVLLYEVCTGHSPFRGGGVLQTLHNVIAEPPRMIGEINPDLPAPLVALIDNLLQKDPARRPTDAAVVAERLMEIEKLPALQAMELPYASGVAVAAAPDQAIVETATARPMSRPQRNRRVPRWSWGVALGLVTLATVPAVLHVRSRSAATRALIVLVQEPRIAHSPTDERSRFAAFALREAALRTLAGLQGIEAMGPDELPGGDLSVPQAARVVAADEVVTTTMDCQGQWCRLSVRRQRGGDGRIVGDTGTFDVSSAPEDSLALANAAAIHLRRAYPDHMPRSMDQPLDVQGEDYSRYLSLRRRMEAGEVLVGAEIDELEQVVRSSPGLVEASVLAVSAALALPDRPRAERMLREAEVRYRDDPRLAEERFLLSLRTGQLAAAEAALAKLERLAPGDVRVWRARAELLIHQGNVREAADVRRRLVRERPSWKDLWYLADVEMALPDAAAARQHLEQLLQVSPGNARGLAKMAELEWQMGDPAKAARIYEDLLSRKITRQNLTNLGWSRLLAGDYPGAVTAYRQALELEPDHFLSRLNLGIAQEGIGDADAARRVYRDLLDRAGRREAVRPLTMWERLIKAQAMARLGNFVPAVAATIEALAEGGRQPELLFQAAVIYALCGDHNHAIVHATEARRRGLSAKWFGIPGFETLRATPEFQELLQAGGSPAPASSAS